MGGLELEFGERRRRRSKRRVAIWSCVGFDLAILVSCGALCDIYMYIYNTCDCLCSCQILYVFCMFFLLVYGDGGKT
jgi:hypothetical protein